MNYKQKAMEYGNKNKAKQTQFTPKAEELFGEFAYLNFPESAQKTRRKQSLTLGHGRNAKQRFEIAFYPSPVQDDVHQNQGRKNDGQMKMDIAPFVPAHRPESFYMFSPKSLVQVPPVPAGARRQCELDNEAGKSQTEQAYEADQIDNEI